MRLALPNEMLCSSLMLHGGCVSAHAAAIATVQAPAMCHRAIATVQAPAMCHRVIATVQAPAMCHCQKQENNNACPPVYESANRRDADHAPDNVCKNQLEA